MTSRLTTYGKPSLVRQVSSTSYTPGFEPVDEEDVRLGDSRLPPVTPEMLDEAADEVLAGADTETAHVMRSLWAYDTTSPAAVAFFRSKIEAAQIGRYNNLDKTALTLPYVLDDKAVRDLSVYAPEFRLLFQESALHDHPVGAACRKIDQQLLMMRIPPGIPFRDIGGNVMYHVTSAGETSGPPVFHKCGSMHDSKDPVRSTLVNLQLRRIAAQGAGKMSQVADRVLRGDRTLACGVPAQQCEFQAPISISVHVYDIRMADWATIMEKGNTRVHEGCVHFSSKFFHTLEGELDVSRARYRIDLQKDEFRMGFVDSSAEWYTHKWTEFMLYGSDQILYGASKVYSYKIVERRGDTLFFRILQMDSAVRPERGQVYKLPDIDMVEVQGFSLDDTRARGNRLDPKTYVFPAGLWNHMLVRATADFMRGGLDYNALFDFYRTIAPRQTINAVRVMGGERVDDKDLVPLVVMAGVTAAMEAMGVHRTIRATTDVMQVHRSLKDESLLFKAFHTFMGSLKALGFLIFFPFKWVGDKISDVYLATLRSQWISWAPCVKLVKINAALVFSKEQLRSYHVAQDVDVVRQHMQDMHGFSILDVASRDPEVARILVGEFSDVLPRVVYDKLADVVGHGSDRNAQEIEVRDTMSDTSTRVSNDVRAARVLAIREAIEEVRVEESATVDFSERVYREVMSLNGPNVGVLRSDAERLNNADLWRVESGILCHSLLKADVAQMAHMAVYLPIPDDDGEHMHMVEDYKWKGIDPVTGVYEERSYRRLVGSSYSGYALTSDRTLIFNGKAISRALEASLSLPHDYRINLQCGPPGCGKTYAIMQQAALGDAVMCPVRESIADTREKMAAKFKVKDKDLRSLVRTVDSFLANYKVGIGVSKPRKLFADECFMTHAGRWYAVCALLGVVEVQGFGDPNQIPHIPRVQVSALHVQLMGDTTSWTYMIYRCPSILVAAWSHVYDYKVRTKSKVVGYFKRVASTAGMAVPDGCVMMAMYQADKLTLKTLYSQCLDRIKILTAHESEGKTYDHVWLHNFEVRKRDPNDAYYLFYKQAHCLVAASRSRKGVLYVKRSDDTDLITEWIEKVRDPRRLAAVEDVATAGHVLEFK